MLLRSYFGQTILPARLLTGLVATKNQALAPSSSGKGMLPTRQNYDSSHTSFARLAAIIACSSITRPLLPARVTLILTLGALVARGLPMFFRHAITAAEIFGHLRSTVVFETSQIDGAVPVFVNYDRDSFGLHTGLLPDTEPQPNLLSTGGLHHLAALKHVALGPRRGNRLLLLVDLLNPGQPFPVVADLLVILAQQRDEAALGGPCKANVVGCRRQFLPADNDVRPLGPLVAFVAEQGRTLWMHFHVIAQFRQGRYKKLAITDHSLALHVF